MTHRSAVGIGKTWRLSWTETLCCTTSWSGREPDVTFFLHGFLGSGRNLERPRSAGIPTLGPTYARCKSTCLATAAAHRLPPRADLNTAARQLLALADHLEVERFDIVGHSLGGRVGLALVGEAAGPRQPRRLTRYYPGPYPSPPGRSRHQPSAGRPRRYPRPTGKCIRFFVDSGLTGAFTDWLLMNLERDGDRFRWRIDRPRLAPSSINATATPICGRSSKPTRRRSAPYVVAIRNTCLTRTCRGCSGWEFRGAHRRRCRSLPARRQPRRHFRGDDEASGLGRSNPVKPVDAAYASGA